MSRNSVNVLPNSTPMYSVNKETGVVVTHHLPWERGNPQLELYEAKGFTYERPAEKEVCPKDIAEAIANLEEADVPNTGDRMLAITDEKGTHILSQKPKRKYHKKVKV